MIRTKELANADLMINFLYGQSKCLIKMKFDRTFTPNARTPMYVNFVLIILLGQCSELSML